MPMTFNESTLMAYARMNGIDVEPTQTLRIRLAEFTESKHEDYIEGWEIRTGRPWNEMTRKEAEILLLKHPQMIRNPGLLSRL